MHSEVFNPRSQVLGFVVSLEGTMVLNVEFNEQQSHMAPFLVQMR